jgi:hypothetical protein
MTLHHIASPVLDPYARPDLGVLSRRTNSPALNPRPRTHVATAVLLALCGSGFAQTAPPAEPPAPPAAAQPAAPETDAPQRVDAVVVQGVRVRERASQSSLTAAELARVPGSGGDPMRAIQVLPGVAQVDDSSAEPAVRGARPQDNLYYVDFLPVGYLFHLGGITSVLNADLVRRFDMYSAGWSPEYGDALGAIFDVSLRRPRTDRIGVTLDFSLLGGSVLVEGPLSEEVSFFLSGRRSWFDLVSKQIEDKDEGATITTPVYSDSQGRLLWNVSADQRLRFDFSTASDRIAFNLRNDSRTGQQDPVLAGNSADRQSYSSAAVVWDGDLGAWGAHTIGLGELRTRVSTVVGTAGRVEATLGQRFLRHQGQWTLAGGHEITLGGSIQRLQIQADIDFRNPRCTEFDPNCDFTSAPRVQSRQNDTQPVNDAFINTRWKLSEPLVGTLGLRVVDDGYLKRRYVDPRAGLEWSLPHGLLVSGVLGRHNQSPDLEQSIREFGNPQLRRLRGTHAALAVSQRIGKLWSWRTEVYGKRFEDLVISDANTNFRNGASGRSEGVELLVKRERGAGRWSGFASMSLSRSQRTNDVTGQNFRFAFDQPVILNVVGDYQLNARWRLGARFSLRSGNLITPIVATGVFPDGRIRPIYGELNSERLPAYHRLDLRADAEITKHFSWYVELLNAYNRKNLSGYDYSADYRTRKPVYQLGVLPSVGVKYKF